MNDPLTAEQINVLQVALRALHHAAESALARDTMNAHIHMTEVRTSPLTLELIHARGKISDLLGCYLDHDHLDALKARKEKGPL